MRVLVQLIGVLILMELGGCLVGAPRRAEIGRICVIGPVMTAPATRRLAPGDRLVVSISPVGCHSSSCTATARASCSVRVTGTDIEVDGSIWLRRTNGGLCTTSFCTMDCGAAGTATCGEEITLREGSYTLRHKGLRVDFTVPSEMIIFDACDEQDR
jgi:hypothetical protein